LRGQQLNEYRRKVQFIFQDPFSSLNPSLKIGPSIMEVMRVHGTHSGRKQRQEAALGLLDDVGLPGGFFNRYPHEFSGGQRQRIGLARALATGPELIICDESVSSLDVSVQAQVLNLLNDLKDKLKLTYLFISHDLAVVKYMADRIMVMREGRLVDQGPSNELFQNPGSDYTRELIDAILD
jgi:peptide/nickel transport system ATP-binding protein